MNMSLITVHIIFLQTFNQSHVHRFNFSAVIPLLNLSDIRIGTRVGGILPVSFQCNVCYIADQLVICKNAREQAEEQL